ESKPQGSFEEGNISRVTMCGITCGYGRMRGTNSDEVSSLLIAWGAGDHAALDRLTPIVYNELRRLAGRYMRNERAGHTLQATALVHEAYTRLIDYRRMQWQGRAHFFAVAAQLMRRILVEHARRRGVKRGAGFRHISLEGTVLIAAGGSGDPDLVALNDAM